jgi:hypothetical protein
VLLSTVMRMTPSGVGGGRWKTWCSSAAFTIVKGRSKVVSMQDKTTSTNQFPLLIASLRWPASTARVTYTGAQKI